MRADPAVVPPPVEACGVCRFWRYSYPWLERQVAEASTDAQRVELLSIQTGECHRHAPIHPVLYRPSRGHAEHQGQWPMTPGRAGCGDFVRAPLEADSAIDPVVGAPHSQSTRDESSVSSTTSEGAGVRAGAPVWQPIATADPDVRVLLFTPIAHLWLPPFLPWMKPELRVDAPRYWTWATHWLPLPPGPSEQSEIKPANTATQGDTHDPERATK